MSAPTTTATADGSLYELVSRGNKDVYFFQDLPDSQYAFDNSYEPQAAFSSEVRRVPPSTACEFGRSVQFDFDLVGDVMRSPTLLIQLPSWLPTPVAAVNSSSVVTDASGVSYGYTNGIGHFLFEQIQFYQDNSLLLEFSGDALWASTQANGTFGHSFVYDELTGQHDGTPLSIGRQATPPLLRLELPIPGCQTSSDPGFPQRSVPQHSYRLKCKLRKLEDLVEASDGRVKPAPWGRTDFLVQSSRSSQPTPFTTLARTEIGPPLLQLETTQVYVTREAQDALSTQPQRLPFKRLWENVFTQGPKDYAGISGGGTSTVTRRLDGRHPSGRILWFFRSLADIQANQLWKTISGYTNLSLLIAGQARELPRSSFVWRDITNFAKEEIDTQDEFGSMNWSLGPIAAQRFPGHEGQPTGTVNFTTADRPTFYIDLAAAGAPYTELRVVVEGWARFDTDGRGRAELFQAN